MAYEREEWHPVTGLGKLVADEGQKAQCLLRTWSDGRLGFAATFGFAHGHAAGHGHAVRVLIADDEAHILHIVSMKLRNAGFDVITAVDGEEAMELVIAEKPNVGRSLASAQAASSIGCHRLSVATTSDGCTATDIRNAWPMSASARPDCVSSAQASACPPAVQNCPATVSSVKAPPGPLRAAVRSAIWFATTAVVPSPSNSTNLSVRAAPFFPRLSRPLPASFPLKAKHSLAPADCSSPSSSAVTAAKTTTTSLAPVTVPGSRRIPSVWMPSGMMRTRAT